MNQVIIYPNDEGSLAVVYPAAECGLPIEEIAKKDVPAGKPYRIIDAALLPQDGTFFDAWEADFSNPDGIGADYGIGSDNVVIAWDENNKPIIREAA
jgi:hypothetical protein